MSALIISIIKRQNRSEQVFGQIVQLFTEIIDERVKKQEQGAPKVLPFLS